MLVLYQINLTDIDSDSESECNFSLDNDTFRVESEVKLQTEHVRTVVVNWNEDPSTQWDIEKINQNRMIEVKNPDANRVHLSPGLWSLVKWKPQDNRGWPPSWVHLADMTPGAVLERYDGLPFLFYLFN